MAKLWWKFVDVVVAVLCAFLLVGEWLERRETRKLLLSFSAAERERVLALIEEYRAA